MGNPNEANETPAYPQEAAHMNAPPPVHDAPPPGTILVSNTVL